MRARHPTLATGGPARLGPPASLCGAGGRTKPGKVYYDRKDTGNKRDVRVRMRNS